MIRTIVRRRDPEPPRPRRRMPVMHALVELSLALKVLLVVLLALGAALDSLAVALVLVLASLDGVWFKLVARD